MTRSRRILLALAAVVAAVVAWPYLPVESFSGRSPEAAGLRSQVTALDAQTAAANAALADQETFARDLAEALAAIPEGPDLATLIDTIDEVIADAGMTWDAGASAPTPSAADAQAAISGVQAWQMTVQVTAPSVQSVSDLITTLRSIPRLVLIPTLSISVSPDTGSVTASLGVIYFSTSVDSMPGAPDPAAVPNTAGGTDG